MGACHARPTIQEVAKASSSDVRSEYSGSHASESTVTISNRDKSHQVLDKPIREVDDENDVDDYDDDDVDDEEGEESVSTVDASVTRGTRDPPILSSSSSSRKERRASRRDKKKRRGRRNKHNEKRQQQEPDGGMAFTSPSSQQRPTRRSVRTRPTDPASDSDESDDDEGDGGTRKSMIVGGAPEPRRLWIPSTEIEDQTKARNNNMSMMGASAMGSLSGAGERMAVVGVVAENDDDDEDDEEGPAVPPSTPMAEPGNQQRPSKKNRKGGLFSRAPMRKAIPEASIPEEEDPEMPSDEEDFRDDCVRNTPKDEPGRLVPVKLKSQPTVSVASASVASEEGGPPASLLTGGEKESVHLQTLSEFQRLKLQVKLQKHQEMKERRVHKVEDKLQDADAYKKLWMEFEKVEQDLATMEQDFAATKRRAMGRSDSFDLKDSESWFFDFQAVDAVAAPSENEDDNSQASLSLLSEQSMDAQKRYYAEMRRRRKEKKKQNKFEKRQQQKQQKDDESGAQSASGLRDRSNSATFLEGATTPDALARLNMANSTASGATRDYGPVRDGSRTPLEVEVSFNAGAAGYSGGGPTDDAGSYVSDLGDESWTGGYGGGSHAGGYSQQLTPSRAPRSNDYGVKRRTRPSGNGVYSSRFSQTDHQVVQAKLSALEKSLAQMQRGGKEEGGRASIHRPAGPSDNKSPKLEPPMPSVPSSHDKKVERQLAEQIEQAILDASTPTRKTKKSVSLKSKEIIPDAATGGAEGVRRVNDAAELSRQGSGVNLLLPSLQLEEAPANVAECDSPAAVDSVTPDDLASQPESPPTATRHGDKSSDTSAFRRLFPADSPAAGDSDASSDATGPLIPTDVEYRTADHHSTDEDAFSSILNTSLLDEGGAEDYVNEEKKEDPQAEDASDTDDDSKSRASSVHNPIIASMSKDEFLRIARGNPVSDKAAFRQESEDEGNSRRDDDMEDDGTSYCSPSVASEQEESNPFWAEVDKILLKNIIPERTLPDYDHGAISTPPSATIVTPQSTSPPQTEAEEESNPFWEEVDKILLKNIIPERTDARTDEGGDNEMSSDQKRFCGDEGSIGQRHGIQQDPDGKRI